MAKRLDRGKLKYRPKSPANSVMWSLSTMMSKPSTHSCSSTSLSPFIVSSIELFLSDANCHYPLLGLLFILRRRQTQMYLLKKYAPSEPTTVAVPNFRLTSFVLNSSSNTPNSSPLKVMFLVPRPIPMDMLKNEGFSTALLLSLRNPRFSPWPLKIMSEIPYASSVEKIPIPAPESTSLTQWRWFNTRITPVAGATP